MGIYSEKYEPQGVVHHHNTQPIVALKSLHGHDKLLKKKVNFLLSTNKTLFFYNGVRPGAFRMYGWELNYEFHHDRV